MNSSQSKSIKTSYCFQRLNKLTENKRFQGLLFLLLTLSLIFFSLQYIYLQQKVAAVQNKNQIYLRELNFLQREGGGFNFHKASSYVQVDSPSVRQLAEALGDPEKIYQYMVDEIGYYGITFENNIYAENVLQTKKSNCLGQANLFCALLRVLGFSSKNCYIIYGSINKGGVEGSHAWVELCYNKRWLVLDPTGVTGEHDFNFWDKKEFYKHFKVLPIFEYNDTYSRFIPY